MYGGFGGGLKAFGMCGMENGVCVFGEAGSRIEGWESGAGMGCVNKFGNGVGDLGWW